MVSPISITAAMPGMAVHRWFKLRNLMRSDKLARWTLLGVQGAMLSELLEEPLFMQSLTVALPHCTHTSVEQARAAMWRAVVGTYQ